MTNLLLLLSIMSILLGCATSSTPPNNSDFAPITTLKDLEGVYSNAGTRDASVRYPIFLSSIIWPKVKGINHDKITTIEVRATDSHTLSVKAIRQDGIEREDTFVEGTDFILNSGRIRLKFHNGIAGFKGDEPMIGVYNEEVEVGVDLKGDGKYRSKGNAVGLVYSFLPIALSSREDVRFIKIGN